MDLGSGWSKRDRQMTLHLECLYAEEALAQEQISQVFDLLSHEIKAVNN
jgi:septation ring formation regulator EzrA